MEKENFRRRSRYILVFGVLAAAFCVVTVLNINTGNVHISIAEICKILIRRGGEGTEANIIWKIRLPRVLMAAILGGALSLSGFLLQTFFSNPIAGPFVLGISSGAKMMVALVMIFFLERYAFVSSYTLIIAAFAGALISTGFILLLSRKMTHMATLLVGGIMIGYICSAITDFVVTFAEDSDIVNLHGWSQGSFSGMSWSNVEVAATVIGVTVVLTFFLSKPIGAYQLGEAYAQSMGVISDFQGSTDSFVQCAFCQCDSFRRSDLIRGNCCSIPDKACAADIETVGCDTGNIYRRCSILYDL